MAAQPQASKVQKRRHVGQYELTRTLGQGSFGRVKLGVDIFTGEKVAIKTIKYKNVKTDVEKKHIEREKAILALLRHPNIVQLHKVVEDEDRNCCYMIMEFVPGGELFDYIVSHGRIKEKDARKFIRQMISALEYCHAHLVVHRDLKPENLLLDENLNIKITDFGLSNIMEPGTKFSTFCGSLHYACPEILRGEAYIGPGVDIWAMGVILYCMVVGSQPWDGRSSEEIIEKIFNEGIVIPDWISEDCANLIISMLRVREKDRIKIEEMKKHPWVMAEYGEPPASFLPDTSANPVTEIDEEIMGMLLQVGFEDTPAHRQEILSNNKTQLVATYNLLLQKVLSRRDASPKRKKEKKEKRKKRKSIEIKDANSIHRKRAHSVSDNPPNLDELGAVPDPKPTETAKASGTRAPAISIYTVDASGATTVETTNRPSSPARSRPAPAAEASPVSPSPPRSPGGSRPVAVSSKKSVAMPKLRLEALKAEAAADEQQKASSAANRLVTIQEDTELAASAPNSPHITGFNSTETTDSDEDFGDSDEDDNGEPKTRPRSPSVAVTDAERASVNRPRSPSVSVPKRPIVNLEDMKKLGPATKRKAKPSGGLISPRHPSIRKSVRDVFSDVAENSGGEQDSSPREPETEDQVGSLNTPTANSGMFGYSTTSSLPSNEIRERVARVLAECGVQFRKDKSNIFHCSNKETRLQIEIVKIAKFKNMKGVKLSRVSGDVWAYKAVADSILAALKI